MRAGESSFYKVRAWVCLLMREHILSWALMLYSLACWEANRSSGGWRRRLILFSPLSSLRFSYISEDGGYWHRVRPNLLSLVVTKPHRAFLMLETRGRPNTLHCSDWNPRSSVVVFSPRPSARHSWHDTLLTWSRWRRYKHWTSDFRLSFGFFFQTESNSYQHMM